jgi:protein-arginine kinase activator protein McsA
MYGHAERLEFEEAARVRDEIKRLKERVLKTPEVPA